MDITTLTVVHATLNFFALTLGFVAIRAIFAQTPALWTDLFVVAVSLVVVTGFLFPFKAFTPAIGTGIVIWFILVTMLLARFVFRLSGWWLIIYDLGIVVTVYFLVLVTIAQSFQKLPILHAIAPNGSEPPHLVVQLFNLEVFVWIGLRVFGHLKWARRFSKPRNSPRSRLSVNL
jgi:hypothetical protein